MLAIRNIGELLLVPPGPVGGCSMGNVKTMESAAILIDGDHLAWFGPETQLDAPAGCQTIDARGGCVVPGLIDCHTHTVFAGSREREFVQRIEGKSYAEIAEMLGVADGTVKSRMFRAVRALRRALPDLDPDGTEEEI